MNPITWRISRNTKRRESVFDHEILVEKGSITIRLSDHERVVGFGERFDAVDQRNHVFDNHVVDHFCHQNDHTYFPLPFFLTTRHFAMFLETKKIVRFDLTNDLVIDLLKDDDEVNIHFLGGNPRTQIASFIQLTGRTLCPPKWAFGPWMSAHRWNSDRLVDEQLRIINDLRFPFTSMVLEQWSDEATFYIFNGAKYVTKEEWTPTYGDFEFDENGPWKDPRALIQRIHDQGLRLLLWQCPIIKELEPKDGTNEQHALDQKAVIRNGLVCLLPDASPYKIHPGHWFPGSMIPDFSNPDMKEWWFSKRKYLLEIGVDGFKTDGGEFIYQDDVCFRSGLTGKDMVNQYSHDYIEAYAEFVGEGRTLFSRAGYVGQQSVGIQWAGDQKSTWSEYQSVYRAGLNAGLSGQTFWSFDIAGFAGDLPEPELYRRATHVGVFTPVMQLHSEPVGGQFSLLTKERVFVNDRTPWNMAEQFGDVALVEDCRKYYWLRMNLLPHIYSESLKCVQNDHVLFKHMMIDYPDDPTACRIDDQHLLANLLVAPVLAKGVQARDIYLPEGDWYDVFDQHKFKGNAIYHVETPMNRLPVFVKSGSALCLNLGDSCELMSDVGNDLDVGPNHLWIYGDAGKHRIVNEDEDFEIIWNNDTIDYVGRLHRSYQVKWIR